MSYLAKKIYRATGGAGGTGRLRKILPEGARSLRSYG